LRQLESGARFRITGKRRQILSPLRAHPPLLRLLHPRQPRLISLLPPRLLELPIKLPRRRLQLLRPRRHLRRLRRPLRRRKSSPSLGLFKPPRPPPGP
jgi:hypothetical protein